MEKKVFVSFDYEKDRYYYALMKAWDANTNIEFVFSDYTSKEIKSDSIPVVKAALTRKINEATHTLVIIGEDANKRHTDAVEIGYTNWQNFEIAKSKERKNKLIGVKIDSTYDSPSELLGAGAKWAMSFGKDSIINALNNA